MKKSEDRVSYTHIQHHHEVIVISMLEDVDVGLLPYIEFWVAYQVATLHG